jgi:hypothetical protein
MAGLRGGGSPKKKGKRKKKSWTDIVKGEAGLDPPQTKKKAPLQPGMKRARNAAALRKKAQFERDMINEARLKFRSERDRDKAVKAMVEWLAEQGVKITPEHANRILAHT